jgi:hypothetical protein
MNTALNVEERDDKESVITQDKLKKFNEINGFENGPAAQDPEEQLSEEKQEEGIEDLVSNPNEGEE